MGGGSFVSNQGFQNGIGINDNLSKLSIGASGTSISHVSFASPDGAILEVKKTWVNECNQGDGDGNAGGFIENFEHLGGLQFDLESESRLTLNDHLRILDNQTVAFGGKGGGNLVLGDNASLAGTLLLNAPTTISGGSIEINEGRLEVSHDSSIDSSITLQNQGGTISLDAEKSLRLKSSIEIANAQN